MSLFARKRSCSFIYTSCLIFILIITFLHIWPHTKVDASRIIQEQGEPHGDAKRLMREDDHVKIQGTRAISTQANRFREFFRDRAAASSDVNNDKGFQDNKRRVPSCPDALHNK